MTPEEELDIYLREASHDTISFLQACSQNLNGMAESALISSVSQYVHLVKSSLRSRVDENSCVSRLDILECQINAFRRCLLDLEGMRERIQHEEKQH